MLVAAVVLLAGQVGGVGDVSSGRGTPKPVFDKIMEPVNVASEAWINCIFDGTNRYAATGASPGDAVDAGMAGCSEKQDAFEAVYETALVKDGNSPEWSTNTVRDSVRSLHETFRQQLIKGVIDGRAGNR